MYDRESLFEEENDNASGLNEAVGSDDAAASNRAVAETVQDEVIRSIIGIFAGFCDIPHGSGNEAALAGRLCHELTEKGYTSHLDDAYNLVCDIPASGGCEDAPLTVLQGHTDMVCAVREGSGYVPEEDPVRIRIDAESAPGRLILRSDGNSSLGADCGIGNAVFFWLITEGGQGFSHGPLRLILTSCEEEGMAGAKVLDPHSLDGASYLINIDGFSGRHIVAGSAGGRRDHFTHKCEAEDFEPEDPGAYCALEFTLTGFSGGHSGYDIDKKRVNAVRLIADLLADMRETGIDYKLSSFYGGLQDNVIPGSAQALVVLKREDMMKCQRSMQMLMFELSVNYGETDWAGRFVFHETALPRRVLSDSCAADLTGFVHGLCNGVYAYTDIEQGEGESFVVDTSINIGKVSCNAAGPADAGITLEVFLRSLSEEFGDILVRQDLEAAEQAHFEVITHSYPAWPFRRDSQLLGIARDAYRAATGREPVCTAVHVGLEPSIFHAMRPDMDMVNVGAEIKDPHSVNERVDLGTVRDLAMTVKGMLSRIATGEARQ